MSLSDPIADYLTRVRNAVRAGKESVTVPSSKMKVAITGILKEEQYISNYKVLEDGAKKSIKIYLKYLNGKKPAIKELKRVSKPSLQSFVPAEKIPSVRSGLGTVILSTSKGILSGTAAKKENVGGEIVCKVW